MDKKISQLTTATTPLTGTETLPIVQGGSTVKTTVQDVLGYVVNDSTNSVLKTVYSASDIGLKLDFANQLFNVGDSVSGFGLNVDIVNLKISLKESTSPFEFYVDGLNGVIASSLSGNDIGLKLDFANNVYQLGTISNSTGVIVNESAGTVKLGDADFAYSNGTGLILDNSNLQIIKTTNQGNDIGLKLDFANSAYSLGDLQNWYVLSGGGWGELSLYNDTVGDTNGINIQQTNTAPQVFLGDFFGINNGTSLKIEDGPKLIRTYHGGTEKGLNLDFANNLYWIGDVIYGNMGFICEVGESKMGDYNASGNGTLLGVSDSNEQIIASSNLSAVSAGSSSGKFLKIKVGGVDYKIALLNNA